MEAIELWTGDRPIGCPWRAFSDPTGVVQDTLTAFRFWEAGLEQFWGPDPPNHLVEAVAHYCYVLELIRSKQREEEDKQREADRIRAQSGS